MNGDGKTARQHTTAVLEKRRTSARRTAFVFATKCQRRWLYSAPAEVGAATAGMLAHDY